MNRGGFGWQEPFSFTQGLGSLGQFGSLGQAAAAQNALYAQMLAQQQAQQAANKPFVDMIEVDGVWVQK